MMQADVSEPQAMVASCKAPWKKDAIAVFVLALIVRVAYVVLVEPNPLGPDAIIYNETALFVAQGKGFVASTGEPTALVPPMYPLFLATIYTLAGHSLLVVRIVQAFLGAVTCVFVSLIAARMVDGASARLSGYVAAFYPPLVLKTSAIETEPLFACLLMGGLWCLMDCRRRWDSGLAGFFLSCALLTRPVLLFFLPFLTWWIHVRHRPSAWREAVMLFMPVLLTVSVWTARNYLELHAIVPLANMAGEALYSSYVVSERGFGFSSWRGLGEEYYSIHDETTRCYFLIRKTIEYVARNPTALIGLEVQKLLLLVYPFDGYWNSLSLGSKYNIWWGLVGSFGMIGLWGYAQQQNEQLLLIKYFLLSYLACVLVFYGSPRFRLPTEPFLVIFAVVGFLRARIQYPRTALAIVGVNVTAFLVFRYVELASVFQFLRTQLSGT